MSYLSQRPLETEFAPYYKQYITALPQDVDILFFLEKQRNECINLFEVIPSDKYDYAYQEGKWTLKEVMQHLMDCERIFCYRALRIARHDKTALAGFDEDEYINHCEIDMRNFDDMVEEFDVIRRGSLCLFKSFAEDKLILRGVANEQPVSVRALAFILAGHTEHHMKIIKERYL